MRSHRDWRPNGPALREPRVEDAKGGRSPSRLFVARQVSIKSNASGGMPIADYDVTVFPDGSWHSSTELYRTEYQAKGHNLQSLFDYLIEKGLVNK